MAVRGGHCVEHDLRTTDGSDPGDVQTGDHMDVASEPSEGQMGFTEYLDGAHRTYVDGVPGPWIPNGGHLALGGESEEQVLPTQAEILRLAEITRRSMRELNAMAWEVGFLERESNWMPNDEQIREIEVT